MQNNNIMNLFGFKDVVFDSFNEDNELVHVHLFVSKMSICPHCGSKRIWIHDHRVQKIRDIHICGKKSLIHFEGIYTKIKTLKRNCFSMKNFNLFRKRIMLSCK
ncbi:MAG: transposase family protein [Peptoniphilus sp.]|uniref:transposase family protein n=1 Tax=Peptoniphilus sp. TaxID=1971214 RepID=UPI002A74A45A|nr:transposase family protein [Peptoniphilus sp.]MDY2987200.1 transposase family protein [Peptoniphilus sp.]